MPRWDSAEERDADLWATEHEARAEINGRYRRVWEHSDATINKGRTTADEASFAGTGRQEPRSDMADNTVQKLDASGDPVAHHAQRDTE